MLVHWLAVVLDRRVAAVDTLQAMVFQLGRGRRPRPHKHEVAVAFHGPLLDHVVETERVERELRCTVQKTQTNDYCNLKRRWLCGKLQNLRERAIVVS